MNNRIIKSLLLAIALLTSAFSLKAQDISFEDLRDIINSINEESLPEDLGDGIIMQSVTLDESDRMIVFSFKFKKEAQLTAGQLNEIRDSFTDILYQQMIADQDFKAMMQLFKPYKYGVRFRITDYLGEKFVGDIPYTRL